MTTNIWLVLGVGVGGLIAGIAVGWFAIRAVTGGTIRLAKKDAEQLASAAKAEAEKITQKAELDAERTATARKKEVEAEVAGSLETVKADQARVTKREDGLNQMMDQITDRQSKLDSVRSTLDKETDTLETEKVAFEISCLSQLKEIF